MVGETGSGKSTLINELLQYQLLPTAKDKGDQGFATTAVSLEILRTSRQDEEFELALEFCDQDMWLRRRQQQADEKEREVQEDRVDLEEHHSYFLFFQRIMLDDAIVFLPEFENTGLYNTIRRVIWNNSWRFYVYPLNPFDAYGEYDDFLSKLQSLIWEEWNTLLHQKLKSAVRHYILSVIERLTARVTVHFSPKKIMLPYKAIKNNLTDTEREAINQTLISARFIHKFWTTYYPAWNWSPNAVKVEIHQESNTIYFEPSCVGLINPQALFDKLLPQFN